MQEIWKSIIGYENLYEVSNLGNVRSLDKTVIDKLGRKLIFHSTLLSQRKTNKNYLVVNLSKDGSFKNYSVHRLVAMAFVENPENKPCVDHVNGNKQDNRAKNLRWVTFKENSNNPITIEKMKISKKS